MLEVKEIDGSQYITSGAYTAIISKVMQSRLQVEENNSLVATFQVTNYHKDKLFVGEPNVEAYDLDTGKPLNKFSCLRPFQVILSQNQTESGQVCWFSQTKLKRVKIIYYHSTFSGETFGWIVGK